VKHLLDHPLIAQEPRITSIKTVVTFFLRLRLPQKSDIVIIESRHGKNLLGVVAGLDASVIDPTRFPIWISWKFAFCFLWKFRRAKRFTRHVLATLEATNAHILLSTDAVSQLTEIKALNPATEVIAVVHGLYIKQPDDFRIRESWIEEQKSDVILFALGEYDRFHYRRWGNVHQNVFAVGSLNDSIYRSKFPNKSEKLYDICIVENSVDPNASKELNKLHLHNWTMLTSFLNQFASRENLKVVVALSQSTKVAAVREWFSSRFDFALDFVDGSTEFATYQAIDSSQISVGETSTALVEGLGRGNKILVFNFLDTPLFDLPVHHICRLHKPNFNSFSQRFQELRNLKPDEFKELTGQSTRFINSYDSEHPTHVVLRTFIEAALLERK
jgi:surface carbohydrate biosynthesis protein